MHEEDWLSVIASLGDVPTAEDLVESLLQDDDGWHDAALTPFRSTWAHQSDAARSFSSAAKQDTSSDASASGHPKPAKRKRNMRPKEEIEYLKGSVLDLENLMILSRQRREAGRSPTPFKTIGDAAESANEQNANSIWAGVASRQYKYLRASQGENEKLRSQVQNQIHIIQSLVRLIQRAQRGLPLYQIPPPTVSGDASMFATKRLELLGTAMQMLQELDYAFTDERFASSMEEISDVVLCQHCDVRNLPGTTLGRGWIRRHVPKSVEALSESLWVIDFGDEISKDTFQIQSVEQSSDRQVLQYSICFMGSNGPIRFYGSIVRLRNRISPSHAFVTSSSMWPCTTNETPWNCVGIDTKEWLVLDQHDGSPLHPRTDVLVNTEMSKLARPFRRRRSCSVTRLRGQERSPQYGTSAPTH